MMVETKRHPTLARVLRLPVFSSHSKQVDEQETTAAATSTPRRNQLEAIRSSLPQRAVDTLGQRPPLRTRTRGVRGQVVHKLVPMVWEVVFPHSPSVPRGRRAGIDTTSRRPGTTEVTLAQRSGRFRDTSPLAAHSYWVRPTSTYGLTMGFIESCRFPTIIKQIFQFHDTLSCGPA